jgi:hypothetical protein
MPTNKADMLNLPIPVRLFGLSDSCRWTGSATAALRRFGASDDRRVFIAKIFLTDIDGLLSVTT